MLQMGAAYYVVRRHGATFVNWEAVGAIAESIGAAAVLVTLVYLARQIKHSSEVTKVASYHQAIDQIVQAGVDPDFSLLRAKFELGEPLTETEKIRSDLLSTAFLFGHEVLLHLHSKGQIDDLLWKNIFDNNLLFLKSPMMLPVLRERPGPLSHELLQRVESERELRLTRACS